jgi:23S rRNA (guanosine2251-2'-O)-methyltransferase
VDAVIWSKNRGASITPIVSKASAGASEIIQTVPVPNLAQATKKLLTHGFDVITAQNSDDATNISEFDFPKRSALIMGSEGKGVQPLLQKLATKSVKIPMCGNISSLNVSQATAVMLSSWSLSK